MHCMDNILETVCVYVCVCVCVCVCVYTLMHAQSYPNVCNHIDCRPPGSSVHGISPARILEWVAISIEFPDWNT